MSRIPSLTILSKEQKFNGDNLLQWNMNIGVQQLLGLKGLLGYIDRSIAKPTQIESTESMKTAPSGTPIYSSTPTIDEWAFQGPSCQRTYYSQLC